MCSMLDPHVKWKMTLMSTTAQECSADPTSATYSNTKCASHLMAKYLPASEGKRHSHIPNFSFDLDYLCQWILPTCHPNTCKPDSQHQQAVRPVGKWGRIVSWAKCQLTSTVKASASRGQLLTNLWTTTGHLPCGKALELLSVKGKWLTLGCAVNT